METLRDRQTSLLRTAPERDLASRAAHSSPLLRAETAVHVAEPVPTPSVPTSGASVTPMITPAPAPNGDGNAVNRFARTFRDPAIPVKMVPYAHVKRFFDILLSTFAIIALSPVMLLIAIAIKLTDRGPIFFKQVRVGQGGRLFWCYKFRSMCVDAESKKALLMHLNEASGPVFKIKHDPRITAVGRFIRKTSLDELPQFFNVWLAHMSVVGPRPPLPSEVEAYTPRDRGRLAVRPGLTCLWQIGGRSNVSFERWVELDLMYIENMSFTTDVMITLKTIPAVLFGRGAH